MLKGTIKTIFTGVLILTLGLFSTLVSASSDEGYPTFSHSTDPVTGYTVLSDSISWIPSEDGLTCTVEYDIQNQNGDKYHVEGAKAQLWGENTMEATCTQPMHAFYRATLFGSTYASGQLSIGEPLGHDFEEIKRVIVKAPTCDTDGSAYAIQKCTRCGLEERIDLDDQMKAYHHLWGEIQTEYLAVENILTDRDGAVIPDEDGMPQLDDISTKGIYSIRSFQVCELDPEHVRELGVEEKTLSPEEKAAAVENLKARAIGMNEVALKWEVSEDADGYIILRNGKQIGYTVEEVNYIDKEASSEEFNFYWVVPFKKTTGGIWPGERGKYVWAIGRVLEGVDALKAETVEEGIKLSWDPVENANGYVILSKTGSNKAPFNEPVRVPGTVYLNTMAEEGLSLYWVYAVYTDKAGNIVAAGEVSPYAWAYAE